MIRIVLALVVRFRIAEVALRVVRDRCAQPWQELSLRLSDKTLLLVPRVARDILLARDRARDATSVLAP